jgi:Bax protein
VRLRSGMTLAICVATIASLPCQASGGAEKPSGGLPPAEAADRSAERFEFESVDQIVQLFDRRGYTREAWQAGVREVPRLYLTDVPERWRDRISKELPVVVKKRIFFRVLGPLVLRSNELIAGDRRRVEAIVAELRRGGKVGDDDRTFLTKIAATYRVGDGVVGDRKLQDELLVRVDTVPPSLVLAQAAEESGWGSSRFTAEGNALFGMWTFGGKGMTPQQQRTEIGNYKLAAYETPLESVMAYMLNLDCHDAYRDLRSRRAELRRTGAKVTGWELAGTLTKYSERGPAYVESLRSLMDANKLRPTDDAVLADGPTVLLVPVGTGVD